MILELILLDGRKRYFISVDHVMAHDGVLSGYSKDGRLVMRQAISSIDRIDLNEATVEP